MFPPNVDVTDFLNAPNVDDSPQRGVSPGMSATGAPTDLARLQAADARAAGSQGPAGPQQDRIQQALSMIVPLFAIGQALGGSAHAGGAMLHGLHTQQALEEQQRQHAEQVALRRQQEQRLEAEQFRIGQAQEASRIAQEQQREEQRQRAAMTMITDVRRQARTLTTKAEHDEFVSAADAMASQAYGVRPGAIIGAVQFVPTPVRERAQKVLDRLKKAAPDGQLALLGDAGNGKATSTARAPRTQPLAQASVSFDVDGDGKDEVIPFRTLEELAGDAFYSPDGQRIVPNQAAAVGTYGSTFSQARGTALADKPLPTNAHGQPDYSKAIGDLRGLNLLPSATERHQARAEGQQQARDRLYAAILDGADEHALTAQFAGTLSGLGMSYRAEVAKIRREIYNTGSTGMSPEDRELSTPADVITRGRQILGGGSAQAAPAPEPVPMPGAGPGTPGAGGRGGRPTSPGPAAPIRVDALHDKARGVLLAEAQRRGLPPGSVTEEQIATFLQNPQNRARLQR